MEHLEMTTTVVIGENIVVFKGKSLYPVVDEQTGQQPGMKKGGWSS